MPSDKALSEFLVFLGFSHRGKPQLWSASLSITSDNSLSGVEVCMTRQDGMKVKLYLAQESRQLVIAVDSLFGTFQVSFSLDRNGKDKK